MEKHIYDITIIGGGPIGMFATYYAGMRNADVQLIESLDQLGGQVSALYPAKRIFDIAGFPEISGAKLVTQLAQQMKRFEPDIKLNTTVESIEQQDEIFELNTNQGTTYSKGVIIAIGNGAFSPRRLAFNYDRSLENERIYYFVKDPEVFKDQTVAIAGGGDSAIDWALELEKTAKQVYIIHRRDQFRGLESSVDQLKNSTVKILTPYLLKDLSNTEEGLNIQLGKVKSDEVTNLTVDKLLVNYGFATDNRVMRNWGIELEHNQVQVNQKMQTNIKNIYAIGDTVIYPGKVKLIANGFGEAPVAVTELLQTIYPERRQPLHSTQLFN